jgi:hypothetical protein
MESNNLTNGYFNIDKSKSSLSLTLKYEDATTLQILMVRKNYIIVKGVKWYAGYIVPVQRRY